MRKLVSLCRLKLAESSFKPSKYQFLREYTLACADTPNSERLGSLMSTKTKWSVQWQISLSGRQ